MTYHGWGMEDSDLAIRLIHAGVGHKDGRFAIPVLHLWHPVADRSRLAENERKLDEVVRSARVRALRGLSALAAEAHADSVRTVTLKAPLPSRSTLA